LRERRRRLAAVLAGGGPDALLFSSHVEAGEGEALFRHACAMNLEGIIMVVLLPTVIIMALVAVVMVYRLL
jgi:hypothetical protein